MSTHVGAMILGRFIVGLGLGLAGPVTAMYVSEVKLSPNCIAGQLSTCCRVNEMIAFCPLTLWCVADISSVSTWYIWQFDPNCHMHWYSGSFTCWPPRSQRPWVVRIFSINFQTFIHLYAYVENFCCVLHTEPSISLTQWFDWLGLIFTLPVVWFHSPLSHFSATCNGPPNLSGATGFTCHRKISGY